MDSSIAFHVAKVAQEEGAEVVLTSFGRTMKITQTIARRLPTTPTVVELDVTDEEHLDTLAERLKEHVDGLDGVLHSIGFAPQGAFDFMTATWDDVAIAMQASAYSLKALAVATLPLMENGGSIVGLTFDAKFAWPVYDWMGVAKAAFESTNRYLRARPRSEGRPREPRLGRPDADHRSQVHPRLRAVRAGLGRAGAAGLGHQRPGARGQGVCRPALRLVPRDDGRDHPRRRWRARHGAVRATLSPRY